MKNILIITIIILVLLSSGCASIAVDLGLSQKGEPNLIVRSTPNNANVILYDNMNKKISEHRTPASIKIPANSSYIEISLDGYFTEKVFIKKSKINPWYYLNFIPIAAGGVMLGLSIRNFADQNYNSEMDYWDNRERHLLSEEEKRRLEQRREQEEPRFWGNILMLGGGVTIGILGFAGAITDPSAGTMFTGYQPIQVSLRTTPEKEEETRLEAERQARLAEERRQAEEARRLAQAAELESRQNPDRLDRSLYRKISATEFSFDMASGRLPAGTRAAFDALFLIRPTGTSYKFHDVEFAITFTTRHNFILHMSREHFETSSETVGRTIRIINQKPVTVYVTVRRPGQYGECTVDIIDW